MNNKVSDTIEAYYIHLLSSVDAAFQEVYEDYVDGGLYGQTLAKIALGQETRETMMVKDVEYGYDNRVFDNPGPNSVENLHYQRRPSDVGPRFSTTL